MHCGIQVQCKLCIVLGMCGVSHVSCRVVGYCNSCILHVMYGAIDVQCTDMRMLDG